MSKIYEKAAVINTLIETAIQNTITHISNELSELREMITDTSSVEELVSVWNAHVNLLEIIKEIIPAEMDARKTVFARAFPDPKENTNTLELAAGWKLKAVHKLDRKIDEATLSVVLEELAKMGVNVDLLIKYKPELELAAYRTMTAENLVVFNQAITTKPGSPQMELVAPKVKK